MYSATDLKAPEVGEGRITPDFVLLAHSLVLGAIDLGNFHLKLRRFSTGTPFKIIKTRCGVVSTGKALTCQ